MAATLQDLPQPYYIGLMSGTSLDGVDGVLCDFSGPVPLSVAHCSAPFPDALRRELLALNQSGADELHRAALAANALAGLYASVVKQLLADCKLSALDVRAIGAHGQTVRHAPQKYDGTGYTLQLNQPALLAELTGIQVVADFRSRDVAAGGQGAPLVPPFHHALFGKPGGVTGVLNIGGISNITVLDPAGSATVSGFDCGPGNALMDAWCQEHTGAAFDDAGAWGASGIVHQRLLQNMLAEPYFSLPAPKSTGRDLFNRAWLQQQLDAVETLAPADVQATLAELTARSCALSTRQYAPGCQRLIVCGGGARNTELMRRLQVNLPGCPVSSSDENGVPAMQVEAMAFAWLARQCVERKTGSLQSVTGARGARILGAIYPA